MITHVVQKWGSRLEEIHCGGVSSSSHTSCFIGWEVWCHWVAYPIKSHSATQKADQLRLTHRKQAALWDTTDNCQNLWKYPPASRKTSHHVPRTGLTACNLPGEVRSTKVFLLFSFFCRNSNYCCTFKKVSWTFFFLTTFHSLSLQGKGAESFVWKFTTKIRSQHHRQRKEKWQTEVRHTFKFSCWACQSN